MLRDQFKITAPNRYHPHSAKAVLVRGGKVLKLNVSLLEFFHNENYARVQAFMEAELRRRAVNEKPSC